MNYFMETCLYVIMQNFKDFKDVGKWTWFINLFINLRKVELFVVFREGLLYSLTITHLEWFFRIISWWHVYMLLCQFILLFTLDLLDRWPMTHLQFFSNYFIVTCFEICRIDFCFYTVINYRWTGNGCTKAGAPL